MPADSIKITGARQHNLKNLSLEIPREKLVVITGLSGSGKSSLAFDTLYAEGQRRYVESLSAYARQFLDQLQKPEVDFIEGLSPAIAIEQRTSGGNPRSTIATTTEIYDYLRLLFASIGQPHDPHTGAPMFKLSAQEIVDRILTLPTESRIVLLAPLREETVGDGKELLDRLKKEGFVRARVNGVMMETDTPQGIKVPRGTALSVEAVVDRLIVREGVRTRLSESVEMALKYSQGRLTVLVRGEESDTERWEEKKFSTDFSNPETGFTLPRLTPRHFSFNSHLGACPACHGLGTEQLMDPDLIVPDPQKSLRDGAIVPWEKAAKRMQQYYTGVLESLATAYKQSMDTPWEDLTPAFRNAIIHGTGEKAIKMKWGDEVKKTTTEKPFDGVIANLLNLYESTDSELSRQRIRRYMSARPCSVCKGARLKPTILAVTLTGADRSGAPLSCSIHSFCLLAIADARRFLESLRLDAQQQKITSEILREILARLSFLLEVGLGYLSLARESGTLSGGEAQRIRLATQIGSGLAGCLYVLDEPSIGLHQRDNDRLIVTLRRLRDLGNSVIVVEHDEDTIRAADHVVDMGPGAGVRGGFIVAEGTPAEICKIESSLTGQYLSGIAKIPVPRVRVQPQFVAPANHRGPEKPGWITVTNANENNLKNITVAFPLGCLTCVTGVSGSGKSTLVDDILRRALFRQLYRAKDRPGAFGELLGLEQIDKCIVIDQTPIGRTPRSNPATYTGAFSPIRDLFSQVASSRVRGYESGRFSFNVKGGRCEACEGDGMKTIEMHFLADVYVECEVCRGRRYNRETLEITYKGKNIADVLDMTVDEASRFFRNVPQIADKLTALEDVGLGYVRLGQSGTTLSGGEAQRIKLATELARKATGRTVYILDEPTTGLHFADIHTLLEVLMKLRDSGNTLIIIEHNLEVIKCADWVVDLGPEGGGGGGQIIAVGPPEDIARCEKSHTGVYLKRMLAL